MITKKKKPVRIEIGKRYKFCLPGHNMFSIIKEFEKENIKFIVRVVILNEARNRQIFIRDHFKMNFNRTDINFYGDVMLIERTYRGVVFCGNRQKREQKIDIGVINAKLCSY